MSGPMLCSQWLLGLLLYTEVSLVPVHACDLQVSVWNLLVWLLPCCVASGSWTSCCTLR